MRRLVGCPEDAQQLRQMGVRAGMPGLTIVRVGYDIPRYEVPAHEHLPDSFPGRRLIDVLKMEGSELEQVGAGGLRGSELLQ